MDNRDIKQTLVELHSELERTPELDDDLRSLLMEVDGDIHTLLAKGGAAAKGETATSGRAAAEGQPNEIDLLRDRVEALAADFAARHPNTESFFREVIAALGRMGI
ncbi:MAG: DUF4404 family protein [Pseudomonadales bacterium]